MKKLAVFALVALLVFALVDVVLSFLGLEDKPSGFRPPAYTIQDSKTRDAFIEPITIAPAIIDWNGKRIVIKEAWLEHRTELVQLYVIVPFVLEYRNYRKIDGYNLCFNLAAGWDVLWEYPGPFFVADGRGSGFGQLGRVVLWERMEDLHQFPMKLVVTDNWKLENSLALEVKREPGQHRR